VTNPDTDLRLASFAMNTTDFETGMVFDVWMTNNAIYPYYERRVSKHRLPGGERNDDHRSRRHSATGRTTAAELRHGAVRQD
jgi:hypothetical protein